MRIGIVNNLTQAREVLRRTVTSVPGYVVAWMAGDSAEAVQLAQTDPPDVILMDLLTPGMDGVEATRRIVQTTLCPILVVTGSVTGNFAQVYEAMGQGALDAVDLPTPGPNGQLLGSDRLLTRLARLQREKVTTRTALEVKTVVPGDRSRTALVQSGAAASVPQLLALGASTGGPEALARILAVLPPSLPAAVIIIQHIAASFAPNLAKWLQGYTPLPVRLTSVQAEPQPGEILLAATDDHLMMSPDRRLVFSAEPKENPFMPSVDVFFQSLRRYWPRSGVAVLLTGMRSDGAAGLLQLRQAGWFTVAQDEATSVVYGMPKAAAEVGAACLTLPLEQIGPVVVARLRAVGDC